MDSRVVGGAIPNRCAVRDLRRILGRRLPDRVGVRRIDGCPRLPFSGSPCVLGRTADEARRSQNRPDRQHANYLLHDDDRAAKEVRCLSQVSLTKGNS